jgi:NADPH:quinone reductase and related Zn-dependent oxidoreductases
VAVDPDWVFDLPEHASYAQGAAFLTTYLTAHIAYSQRVYTDSVLVHAGSGGVGTAAIQLGSSKARRSTRPPAAREA